LQRGELSISGRRMLRQKVEKIFTLPSSKTFSKR